MMKIMIMISMGQHMSIMGDINMYYHILWTLVARKKTILFGFRKVGKIIFWKLRICQLQVLNKYISKLSHKLEYFNFN